VQEVIAVGPGVATLDYMIRDDACLFMGDADRFILGQFGGSIRGEDDLTLLSFQEYLEAWEAFNPRVGWLIDIEFGTPQNLVNMIGAGSPTTALPQGPSGVSSVS
jgi:hypothetical protein